MKFISDLRIAADRFNRALKRSTLEKCYGVSSGAAIFSPATILTKRRDYEQPTFRLEIDDHFHCGFYFNGIRKSSGKPIEFSDAIEVKPIRKADRLFLARTPNHSESIFTTYFYYVAIAAGKKAFQVTV